MDTDYGIAALRGECERVRNATKGTRNDTLNTAAFRMGQLIAGGQLSEETAVQNLNGAACSAALGPTEARATIRSGIDSGMRATARVPEPREERHTPATAPGTPQWWDEFSDDLKAAVAAAERRGEAVDWRAAFEVDYTDEWIIEPLIAQGRQTALYSAAKVGKSLLALEITTAASMGVNTLGVPTGRPWTVLYVDHENHLFGDVIPRLKAMGRTPDQLDRFKMLSFESMPPLDTPAGAATLLGYVKEYGAELVVLDTVSRLIQGVENENDTWLQFYRYTGMALKAANVALLRLDHSGKDETKGQRGGSAKSGDVDAIWQLSKDAEDENRLYLKLDAARMIVHEPRITLDRVDEPTLQHNVYLGGSPSEFRAKVAEIAGHLWALFPGTVPSQRNARPALKEVMEKVGTNAALCQALRAHAERIGS